jgi:hypothetical protein
MDGLNDTVHYGDVAERVAAVVRENMLARLATESPRSSSVEVDRRPWEEYRTFRISTFCQLTERNSLHATAFQHCGQAGGVAVSTPLAALEANFAAERERVGQGGIRRSRAVAAQCRACGAQRRTGEVD